MWQEKKIRRESNCKTNYFCICRHGFVGVILLVVAGNLSVFYTLTTSVEKLAAVFIVVDVIVSILIYAPCYVLPDSLRAAGEAKFTMKVSTFSMIAFRVAGCYTLAAVFGVWGVVAGKYIDWGFRALAFTMRYCSSKWLEMKVV